MRDSGGTPPRTAAGHTDGAGPPAARLGGLRAATFASLLMLLVQYGLGMWVNLYGLLPPVDRAAGVSAAFAAAVTGGPPELAAHALLGLLLLLTAISVVSRAAAARCPVPIAAAVTGLLAVAAAAVEGARFIAGGGRATSMVMAAATGVAMMSYAVVLFVVSGRTAGSPSAG